MSNKGPGEYLALAQDAELAANRAETSGARDSWQAIAQEYRMLAAEKLKQMQAARAPDVP
jgi:hypothetical protein